VARIAGVDLPRDKRIEIGLTYIYGIGLTRSREILATSGVNPDTRVKDLSETDVAALRGAIDEYQVEGDLRRWETMNIKRLMDIGCSSWRSSYRCREKESSQEINPFQYPSFLLF
jgi:small subunit ribosomal protein S13